MTSKVKGEEDIPMLHRLIAKKAKGIVIGPEDQRLIDLIVAREEFRDATVRLQDALKKAGWVPTPEAPETQKPVKYRSVDEMVISTRSTNCLRYLNCETVIDVACLAEGEVLEA